MARRSPTSGINLPDFFTPTGIVHPSPAHILVELVNGYSGTNFSPQYFGVGVLAVAVGGMIVWRRDRRLWLFAAVGVVSTLLSLGVSKTTLLPWQLLANLPEFENVIPGRFVLIICLCLAVMLGLIVDHTYGAVRRWVTRSKREARIYRRAGSRGGVRRFRSRSPRPSSPQSRSFRLPPIWLRPYRWRHSRGASPVVPHGCTAPLAQARYCSFSRCQASLKVR